MLVTERNILDSKISFIENSLSEYSFLKSIIYTKGADLEIGVSKCLNHLGIRFTNPEGSNTDLIIEENENYFAIEIKGGVGSATKQHVRQLEEWVNSTASIHQVDEVKGVLIINTFHNIPIKDRNPINFPPNVIEFSEPRKHCLITTITLLNIINDFDNKVIDKQNILTLIKSTSGVLKYTKK